MADDFEMVKPFLRGGSLCSQPDPQQQLKMAFDEKSDKFKELLESGIANGDIDPNYWYEDPDNGTLLDIACRHNRNDDIIELLLKNGADPNLKNPVHKKAPLHVTVGNGNLQYTRILLKDDRTDVNTLDNTGSPPLFYAAKTGDVDLVITLINHPKINLNLTNRKGQTAIHLAALFGTKETVQCLLDKNALDIDSFKMANGKTARDLIMEKYPELDYLLNRDSKENLDNIDDIKNRLFYLIHSHDVDNFVNLITSINIEKSKEIVNVNNGNSTLLQYSCQFGLVKIVETLLNFGADPNATIPSERETPIMIAASKGYFNIVRLFIRNDTVSYRPIDGRTVLHSCVLGSTMSPILGSKKQEIDHYKCLDIFLKEISGKKLDINSEDDKGNSALHYAVKIGDRKFILMLLHHGAYIGQRNILNQPALADIDPKIFEKHLDNCVTKNHLQPMEDNFEIIFRYNFLVPPKNISDENLSSSRTALHKQENHQQDSGYSETDPLLYMSSSELRPLLKHPVLTSFLYLKWKKIEKIFYLNLAIFTIFLISLISYIYIFTLNDKKFNSFLKSNVEKNASSDMLDNNIIYENDDDDYYWAASLKAVVTFFLLLLIIRESFQFIISPFNYLFNLENLLEVALIGLTISILFGDFGTKARHQIAASAILVSGIEFILLIGRHPSLSTYIEMFKTVSANFLKFLAWYSILILAFALSFNALFNESEKEDDSENGDNNFFNFWYTSIFKTIVMLTGEFDTGDIPFNKYPRMSYFLFVLFIFLIAIVLFNLLNGLAVSDTNSIKADAELVSYVSRVKLVAYFENMVVHPDHGTNGICKLFCCIPDINICPANFCCGWLRKLLKRTDFFSEFQVIPEYPDYEVRVLPNQDSRIEMLQKKKHADLEDGGDVCFDIFNHLTMDKQIVRDAKIILNKKREAAYGYFDDHIKFDVKVVEKLNDFESNVTTRLELYNDLIATLIKNSERNQEQLNKIMNLVNRINDTHATP